MQRIRCFLLGLFLAIPSSGNPQVLVVGSLDCGLWVHARTLRDSVALEHYVLGLVNGMSLRSNVPIWGYPKASISKEQAYLWFDKYCTNNPLRDVPTGILDFANEMTNGLYSKTIQSRH